jgi:hypothetical protein
MPWARIVPSESEALDVLAEIRNLFALKIWPLHASPDDAALFTKGKMIYFSPRAAEISRPHLPICFRLMDCPPPLCDEVEVLVAGDLNEIPFASE